MISARDRKSVLGTEISAGQKIGARDTGNQCWGQKITARNISSVLETEKQC